jgi:hypothetical protein
LPAFQRLKGDEMSLQPAVQLFTALVLGAAAFPVPLAM